LPYKKVKRRVIFQRCIQEEQVKPKNVIIQWGQPRVQFSKQFKDLGVIHANPEEYIMKYGETLKKTEELPDFVHEIQPPSKYNGMGLEQSLYGDVEALRLIDLDKEGLSECRDCLEKYENLVSTSCYNINSSELFSQKQSQANKALNYNKTSSKIFSSYKF
jgi:hypothetical protein